MHDASSEHKTAENLVVLLEDVMETLQKEWAVDIVVVVTDASEESHKA